MTKQNFFDYIEDEKIEINDNWFFHATDGDINTMELILKNGVISTWLRHKKSNQGYNGKYYVSVSKKTNNSQSVYKLFEHLPMFVLDGIHPIYANKNNKGFGLFTETIIPLRTSSKSDEYHALFRIKSSKIIAIGYNLYTMLSNDHLLNLYYLQNLKELILLLGRLNNNLPIYDFSLNRVINKDRVKMLNFEKKFHLTFVE